MSKQPKICALCGDKAVAMTVDRKNRHFVDQTDGAIMQALIGDHDGLSADVAATTRVRANLVQYGRTDWAVHVALWDHDHFAAGAVSLPALGLVFATDPAPVLPPQHNTSTPARQVMSAGAPGDAASALKNLAPSMCTDRPLRWARLVSAFSSP